jgi:hypothetical protein
MEGIGVRLRTCLYAFAAVGAEALVHETGLPEEGDLEISRLTLYRLYLCGG